MAKLTPIYMIYGKQLAEVTGARDSKRQIQVLKDNGIPYILDAANEPRVLKDALLLLDRGLKTKETDPKTQPKIPLQAVK